VDPDQVKEIRVKSFYEAVDCLGVWRPSYVVDAMFSLPHLIALVLLGRGPGRGLREEDLHDPKVKELEAKVTSLELDSDADKAYRSDNHQMPSTVTVTMLDGTVRSATVVNAKGDPEDPLTMEELQQKFRQLVCPVLGAQKTERIIERVRVLEKLGDVSEVVA
jgi:2-methylcitrate dehydratase PrpD